MSVLAEQVAAERPFFHPGDFDSSVPFTGGTFLGSTRKRCRVVIDPDTGLTTYEVLEVLESVGGEDR